MLLCRSSRSSDRAPLPSLQEKVICLLNPPTPPLGKTVRKTDKNRVTSRGTKGGDRHHTPPRRATPSWKALEPEEATAQVRLGAASSAGGVYHREG